MTSGPPLLIDSHAHLHRADFPDRDEVLARARAAGVRDLVFVGSGGSPAEAREAAEFAERDARVWAAVGMHPHDAWRCGVDERAELAALARRPRVVAVGETGLDYHYLHSPRDAQIDAFRFFARLARELGKPVVCHVRDAHEDARQVLREESAAEAGAVIHCFTGGRDDALRYLDLGCHISLSGIVTFKNAAPIREAAAVVPPDRLLLETDCPYLAPVPLRGRRNEPAFLAHTAAAVAAVRGAPVARLAAESAAATRALFSLPVREDEPHDGA